MRQMPRHYVRFFWMAWTLSLDCPAGRALYACNRKAMGGLPLTGADMDIRVERVLRRARTSTAERWLAHWRAGGTIYHSKRTPKQMRALWKARRTNR
ncbi:hypothetical protein UFOVP1196_44 [uncultured Caudovirales phage]|uniref:Uncharacterized protein n=1 Tax=uncultured Caudovirales phage TaxID=2100421 RepID=A0A6J5R7A3_9CAUD|nr:hypothetical protein UFOVP1196_44 [uncultured Caudovirales phage]